MVADYAYAYVVYFLFCASLFQHQKKEFKLIIYISKHVTYKPNTAKLALTHILAAPKGMRNLNIYISCVIRYMATSTLQQYCGKETLQSISFTFHA